jgi:NADH dehydrogenase
MIQESAQVVVAGSGFAGLWVCRGLARSDFDVRLIDRDNYHTFLPLLYQVAAAELEPEAIAFPLRHVLRRDPRVSFLMAELDAVNLGEHAVSTSRGAVSYEYLVLALGSVTSYFGVPGAEEFAFPLKTVDQGIALRNHILRCFELADLEREEAKSRQLLTFAIIGGGPTGVEFAGALIELVRGPIGRDYRRIDPPSEVRVLLLQAVPHLLPGLPRTLQEYTLKRLRRMGVEVRLGSPVTRVSGEDLQLEDGTLIPTRTAVWTAGVQGAPVGEEPHLPLSPDRRILVSPTLQVPGHPNVYAVGDLARLDQDGQALPLTAPVAIQQAAAAAKNIQRQHAGLDPLPFHYRDRGTMVTIGRNKAVATPFGRSFKGLPAWLLWLGFHLVKLIGFRNRVLVLLNWAWDYVFLERAVRLILPREANESTNRR